MDEYFHELDNIEKRNALLTFTIGDIMAVYKQPKWCDRENALNGLFGCEILLGLTNEEVTKNLCSNCENFKNEII